MNTRARRASIMIAKRRVGAWILSVPGLLCVAACSKQENGEVVVVVTTDMALPADLDRLEWTVTRLAHPESVPDHQSVPLSQADSLPATLAIVAQNGEEPVLVSLDGWLGSDDEGTLRVHREARVTVPATGQKMLKMPLNWLCSDTNLLAPCDPGLTCQAGRCVSSQIEGPLADYVPFEKSPCFDVLACSLVGSTWRASLPDMDSGVCFMDANTLPAGQPSVSLVIDTSVVGNAGVCAPSSSDSTTPQAPAAGLCFVPINQDNSPEGWQLIKDSQQRTVIQLPAGVCDAVANGSVQRVALTSAGCPSKTSDHPLCAARSVCESSPSSCPATFPASWSGYSCSGPALPSSSKPELTYCPISDSDPFVGRIAQGHFCCTAGQAPGADPLLIDDMSAGSLIKFPHPPDESAGNWFTASDDTKSPLSPPQRTGTLFTYRAVPPVTPPGGPEISHAACFTMSAGFSGNYALEGFSFISNGVTAVPVDVSQFTGITFWAMLTSLSPQTPAPIRADFANSDTDTEHQSTCMAANLGKSNCNHFGLTLDGLTSDWQQFSVTWGQLTQSPGFGEYFDHFDPNVYSVDFESVRPAGLEQAPPFDFCVSQIYFTQ